ncbi:hypothetical protein P717_03695 [Enterobacter kobei]|nr:hypothetical protein P717_03695 [Enterobacter kobei]
MPANAVQLHQAVMRDLLSSPFERVTGGIPAAGPAARRRALGIAGKVVPAIQSTKTIVFAAGGRQHLGATGLAVEFVAGILAAY